MRFQLALNVKNLDQAVAYYSKLLGVGVNKRKPGYANFAVESPPLKLVLFEAPDASQKLNHVGFEMDADEVVSTIERLEPEGLADHVVMDETCCYAEKSTVYSHDPEGLMWEFYKLRGDSETFGKAAPTGDHAQAGPETAAPASSPVSTGSCCAGAAG